MEALILVALLALAQLPPTPGNPGLSYLSYTVYEVEDTAALKYTGSNTTVTVDWLVPLNNSHQLSYILELEPRSYRFTRDRWGNPIYKFRFEVEGGNRSFKITGRYRVICYTTAPRMPVDDYGRLGELNPESVGELYLKPTYWWNYTDPAVEALLEEVRREAGSEDRVKILVEKVKAKVNSMLSYKVVEERLGASEAVRRGYGDCEEFTDLTIALARGLGIPARRVLGVYVEGSEVKGWHAWVEVWTPRFGWIPLEATDPTGGSKKPLGYITSSHLAVYVEGYRGSGEPSEELEEEEWSFDVKPVGSGSLTGDFRFRFFYDLAVAIPVGLAAAAVAHTARRILSSKIKRMESEAGGSKASGFCEG